MKSCQFVVRIGLISTIFQTAFSWQFLVMVVEAKMKALSSDYVVEQPASPFVETRKHSETLTLVGPSRWTQFMGLIVVVVLTVGFILRKQEFFVPGEGIGYQLGLSGGTVMLLLFYPLVKRVKFFSKSTHAGFWFNWHMMLGVIGPVLIFFHSNFSLGATNSNIAFFTMILVAVSGVVGRYVYGQIHNGLNGAKLDVGGLLAKATRLMSEINGDVGGNSAQLTKALADFSEAVLPKTTKFIPSLINTVLLPIKINAARTRIMSEVRRSVSANARLHSWSRAEERSHLLQARLHVLDLLNAVSRAAQSGPPKQKHGWCFWAF